MIDKVQLMQLEKKEKHLHERLERAERLGKLADSQCLIDEIKMHIQYAENSINGLVESEIVGNPQEEQVYLKSHARVKIVLSELLKMLTDSPKAVETINNRIAETVQKIRALKSEENKTRSYTNV